MTHSDDILFIKGTEKHNYKIPIFQTKLDASAFPDIQ